LPRSVLATESFVLVIHVLVTGSFVCILPVFSSFIFVLILATSSAFSAPHLHRRIFLVCSSGPYIRIHRSHLYRRQFEPATVISFPSPFSNTRTSWCAENLSPKHSSPRFSPLSPFSYAVLDRYPLARRLHTVPYLFRPSSPTLPSFCPIRLLHASSAQLFTTTTITPVFVATRIPITLVISFTSHSLPRSHYCHLCHVHQDCTKPPGVENGSL